MENTLHIDSTCNASGQSASTIEALNQSCRCLSVDVETLRHRLEADLASQGLSVALLESHPHLFASLPVFVGRKHLEQMTRVIEAVETVVESSVYQHAALAWAPDIARFDPGTRGGLLGFDFHVTDTGPKLIEINTNPGGVLLNVLLGEAQRACCDEAMKLKLMPAGPDGVEQAIVAMFRSEWRLQRGAAALQSMAIVDESPDRQYLYPELVLFRQLLKRNGIDAVICDPQELAHREGRLWHRDRPIDFVYNRLTDFSLELSNNAALRSAYLAREVVVSPHPRAHALYADKRNLSLLSDGTFLSNTGLPDDQIASLLEGIPKTEVMTADNRDAMWANRRHLFFKPAAGFGSKGAYRGEKVTKRVWEAMAEGTYVAQSLVAPGQRRSPDVVNATPLRVDIRNYAYEGAVHLVAARLYRGQTTNFRTTHGGFAPVLTSLV